MIKDYMQSKGFIACKFEKGILYQKKIDSKIKCETNGDMHISVAVYDISVQTNCEVYLCFELFNQWWNLKCYSITEDDLLTEKLDWIISNLVNMAETIKGV